MILTFHELMEMTEVHKLLCFVVVMKTTLTYEFLISVILSKQPRFHTSRFD